ncbi:N-glycosylase/DNA lyase [Candidatus Altiarchaeota archaeon]
MIGDLVDEIESLKKSETGELVRERIKEFAAAGKRDSRHIFGELCFCILTANFTAEKSIRIQEDIGRGFLTYSPEKLAARLKGLGHRFPNTRAGFIVSAREHEKGLKKTLASFSDDKELRDWIVDNIKGLGMKEASHFMRNIGYKDVAIIDFHIIDLLVRYGLISRPKTLTRKRYLLIEEVLEEIAQHTSTTLAELDLYLWYQETGKILK